jgi:hypothetical protein
MTTCRSDVGTGGSKLKENLTFAELRTLQRLYRKAGLLESLAMVEREEEIGLDNGDILFGLGFDADVSLKKRRKIRRSASLG